MAGRHKFKIDQGTLWRRWIILWQDETKAAVVPLAGFTAALHIRRTPDAVEAAAILTTENGGIVITPETGKIEWTLGEAETDPMDGEYDYELRILNADGEPFAVLKGKIQMCPEVVHP